MSQKSEKAKQLFLEGYNCCQSVVGAFCEDVGLDLETALKLSSSFGAGMGRLREVCGAVSGMFIIAGLKCGYTSPTDKIAKQNHYKLIQEMAEKFKKENGTIICRELLGEKSDTYIPEDRTKAYYEKRPCASLIEKAAQILEETLNL